MSQQPAGGREAIDKLFRHPELSMDRLPVLKDAFLNLASDCADGLRTLCPYAAVFEVEKTGLGNASEALEKYHDGLTFIFNATGWDTRIAIGLERALVHLLVESVFGGDGSEAPEASERAFSKLEFRLAQRVAEIAAASFNQFFNGLIDINLVFDRVETEVSPNVLGPADCAVARAQIGVQLIERQASMSIMIPETGLIPLRAKLERRGVNATASIDEDWTHRLKDGLESTTVSLRAVMHAHNSTLGEIAALKVGSVIELPVDAQNSLVATCNGSQIFTARLVQSKGHYALAINAFTNSPTE